MKRKLAGADTEDNTKGKIYWLNFFDGEKHYSFKDRDSAILFLKSQQLEIWVCNLEYDIFNIFGEKFFDLCRYTIGDRILRVYFKNNVFYDTFNHWKLSVRQMGEIIGQPKQEQKFKSLRYCQNDTEIVYKFVKKMKDEYSALNIPLKLTVSSTSFNYWKKFYWKSDIKKINKNVLKYLHRAYYGGRCECFFIGKAKGAIRFYDVNSMYPSVMLSKYPEPFEFEKKPDLKHFGVTDCLVESKLKLPILPYRTKEGRLIFPNGRFRGIWDNTELLFARSEGIKILKIYGGINYKYQCEPFKNYISKIYFWRKKAVNEYQKTIFKLMMNALYGKFGQVNEGQRIISLYNYLGVRYRKCRQSELLNDYVVIYKTGKYYPVFTNMIWALHTTALARIKLYKYIKELSRYGQVLYCDTDSIFLKQSKAYKKVSDDLGKLKLSGIYKIIKIVTNKFYAYGNVSIQLYKKIKGIPYSNMDDFFKNFETTYKKPIRMREGLRRKLPVNVWINHTKKLRTKYDKGKVLKSGKVIPLVMK